jgi:hypothetical protein
MFTKTNLKTALIALAAIAVVSRVPKARAVVFNG